MSDAREILDKVASGEMTPEEAETALKMKPFVDLGFAKPDLHRGIRHYNVLGLAAGLASR